jgi:hypothetical protein
MQDNIYLQYTLIGKKYAPKYTLSQILKIDRYKCRKNFIHRFSEKIFKIIIDKNVLWMPNFESYIMKRETKKDSCEYAPRILRQEL